MRHFLAAVLVAALLPLAASPLPVDAQQPGKLYRIGVIANEAWRPTAGLRQGFQELGYVEGKNLQLEYRWAGGELERYVALAAELVAIPVDVIVTWGTPATLAAQRATTAIPIVMSAVGDPVGSGAVSNLSRPDGNTTGFSSLATELDAKRVELLRDLLPRLQRLGVVANPANQSGVIGMDQIRRTAASLRLEPTFVAIRNESEFDSAFSTLLRARPEAVLVMADPFLETHQERIVRAMAQHRLPALYGKREYVEAGGLLSYAPDYHELFRRAATYVDKILKGTKPSDLPVQQATKFELVISARAAKALGIEVPPLLLARADEVIE